jgi:hypothetical protein
MHAKQRQISLQISSTKKDVDPSSNYLGEKAVQALGYRLFDMSAADNWITYAAEWRISALILSRYPNSCNKKVARLTI